MFTFLADKLTPDQIVPPVNSSDPAVVATARADYVLSLDLGTLDSILEAAWGAGGRRGSPGVSTSRARLVASAVAPPESIVWQHLIYAYMIENTRIYEIFRRVAWELLHGEKLGQPLRPATYHWLETTEELFFRETTPRPLRLTSRIRPDLGASRRNAYYRMFGMDLNHGAESGGPYPYEKPAVANREFVATIEEFLREVWRAIENARNTSGPNVTDPAHIANLASRLQDMLNARRGGSVTGLSLSQDEFVHVTTMSWFHLTVSANTAVVSDLRAGAPSPEERLRQIGERVGVPAHGRSHNYFRLAVPISILLTQIEIGLFSTVAGANALFVPPPGPPSFTPLQENVIQVINHWSMITGRDMKAPKVAVSGASAVAPMARAAVPTAGSGAGLSTNGHSRVPVGGSTT